MYKRGSKRKSKTIQSPDDASKTPKVDNELEVTGVSRSGRVRKKSSKLIDYESGAEEDRPKKKGDTSQRGPSQNKFDKQELGIEYPDNEESINNGAQNLSESEPEGNIFPAAEPFDDSSAESSGTELDDDMDDKLAIDETPTNPTAREITYTRSVPSATPSTSQKSLYMLEKFANKRKNGRGGSKAGRKDKGKARFSAYMLWAREVRPDLMKANPNIDFSQLSSRLSDLWATVPYTEKYIWKQKAKRMAMMAKDSDNKEEVNAQKQQIKTTLRRKYINKKSAHAVGKSTPIQDTRPQSTHTEITSISNANSVSPIENKTNFNDLTAALKNVSTQPLDVAAHLKLLGESLSIIGQRLKEHEGQIAVSGSLSVLLDTLLCSLGPLLCLTQQVEEMNGCNKEVLSSILDNIAYIMPGL